MTLLALATGDAATWVGAFGTVGTLAVSLWLLYRAGQDRRLEQARKVAAWMDAMDVTEDGAELVYRVRNASQEPAYEVTMNAMCGVRGTFVRFLGTLGPGETRELRLRLPGQPRAEEYPPALSFTDSAGRSWLRDAHGTITAPSGGELSRHSTEDAGAYPSVDEHPTLRLDTPGYEHRGRKVVE